MGMVARHLSDAMTVVLGDAGDLSAEPGSRPWAVAVRVELQATLADLKGNADHLGWMYRAMAQHKGYSQLADERGQPFRTFMTFCQAAPPFGLGMPPEFIERIIEERKTAQGRSERPKLLLSDSGPMTTEESASIGNDVTNRVMRRGNDADYLTARIARDRPDVLNRMKAGEFKSVRAAALEAGIVKPAAVVRINPQRPNPEHIAKVLRETLSDHDIARLIDALQQAPEA